MAETSTSSPASTAAPATMAAASTPATPATPSGPTSTSDIAASVIADIEAGGSGNDEGTPATPAVAATAPVVPATTVDPDDFDAVPAETVDALGRKRANMIPQPRVKTMLTKHEQKVLGELAKELGMTVAEGKPIALADVIATVKERGTKHTASEGRLQQMDRVETLIKSDPDRFMEIIGNINPAYKAFVKAAAAAAGAPVTPATPAVTDDPEPQPDYDLGDGNMTYSLKGMQKLRAWERRQAKKEIEEGLAGRFAPLEERLKAEKQKAADEEWRASATERVRQRYQRASQWPKFAENSDAILNAMKTENLSVEDAYMKVVIPGLAGDRTKIRQEVLDELNAVPKTSSVAATTAPKPASDKVKTTAEIAREVIASMG